MRRLVLAPLFALLVFGAARDAAAQEARTIPVRVRLGSDLQVADVLVERDGKWDFACRAPCTFDATPNTRVRINVLGGEYEPLDLTVPADAPEGHDVEVGRKGRGYFVGGLAAIGAGAISMALGMAIIRGADKDDLFGDANGWIARAMLLLGAGSVVTGSVLIVTRSTAPMIMPPANRKQTHEDLLPGQSNASLAPMMPPQLVWTTTF